MQKKFVTSLGILLFLNLLIKPFWILVIEPHVQNEVGNAAYGEYFALFNFSFLLNILLDFGITNFNNKNIAQNSQLLTKHFSGLFMLKLMLAVVYIIATIIVGLIIRYDVRFTKLLLILGFNQFLISLVLYLRSNLQALHLFKTDAVLSVLDRVIMITIVSMMLWTSIFPGRMDVMDFVYAQTVGYFLTAVIAFFSVIGKTKSFRLKWDWPFSLMILKKSFPFAILVLLIFPVLAATYTYWGTSVTSPAANTAGFVVRCCSSTMMKPRVSVAMPAVARPSPSVRGVRPVATRTRSPVATFPVRVRTRTRSSCGVIVAARSPMTVIPSVRKALRSSEESSGSACGASRPMMVTSTPSRANSWACSRPIWKPNDAEPIV